jgi:PAS domain S-box-containing protein
MTEKLKKQADSLSNKMNERAVGFEKMNSELLQQIKTHKHNEHNISEELELFKSITLQQKDLVLRINTEGQILYHNPPFEHVKKINAEIDESVLNYFGNGDFPGLDFIIHDFEKNIQRVNCEIQMDASGIQWFNVSFIPIRNKRGLLTEIQIAARNINEIKKLEYKLLFQRKMLFSMLNTMDHVSFTINKNGIIDLISNNLYEITGVSPSLIRGKDFREFVHSIDIKEIEKSITNLIKRKESYCLINFRLKRNDETWYWQKAKLKLVFNDKEKTSYFVGFFSPLNNDEE